MIMTGMIYPLDPFTVIHFPTNAHSDAPLFFPPFLHRLAARAASPLYGFRAACPPNSVTSSDESEFYILYLSQDVGPMVLLAGSSSWYLKAVGLGTDGIMEHSIIRI